MSAEIPAVRGPLHLVRHLDPRLFVPALLLVALGVSAIAASKPEFASAQLRWCGVGLALSCGALFVPYRRLLDLAWPAWALSVALLAAVLVFGEVRNGARRWLQLGPVGLQPSEFAKVVQVLVLARYIRFRRDQRTLKGLFVPFLVTLVPMSLILMEPDLGTAGMFVPVLFAMLWAAGARTRHLLAVVALGVASLPILYFSVPHDNYQKQRVEAFLPVAWRTGDPKKVKPPSTFQRDEGIAAVATGGLLGSSPEEDESPQFERVPFSWTDFVFVVHAERWGFAGVALLLGVFGALLAGFASLAAELKEPAARLMCVGSLVLLGTQACINVAMTMGLFPITGVPLPFLSYGGSSMLASWLFVALVLTAKARQPVVFSTRDFD